MKLSVVLPVYNEKNTIRQIVDLIEAVPVDKELLIVDDGSTDGTREIIQNFFSSRKDIRVILHDKNKGKGAAVRTGIAAAEGDVIIIQDADLEYNPSDYAKLLPVLSSEGVGAAYGSRFLGRHAVTTPWHRFVNFFLTALTNTLYGSRLTDMETCYKMIRTPLLKQLALESSGFEVEVELTAKLLLAGEKIVEVPIAYKGRSFHEGKKIGWRDGLKGVSALFRYRFFK